MPTDWLEKAEPEQVQQGKFNTDPFNPHSTFTGSPRISGKSSLVTAAELFHESYNQSAEGVPQAQSDANTRPGISAQGVSGKPLRAESDRFRSPLSFQAPSDANTRQGISAPRGSGKPSWVETEHLLRSLDAQSEASTRQRSRRSGTPPQTKFEQLQSTSSLRISSPKGSWTPPQAKTQQLQSPSTQRGLQSPLSLHELHESMKSLHVELSQMGISIRSIIRSELSESMKAFQREQSQMNHSMRTIIRKEFEESMKLAPVAEESQTNGTVRSIIRSENSSQQEKEFLDPPAASGSTLAEQNITKPISTLAAPGLEEPLLGGATDTNDKPLHVLKHRTSCKRTLLKVDGQASKDGVRNMLAEALSEDECKVDELYHESGPWQVMARQNSWFSFISLIVVAANVVWIGIDEDLNQEDVLCNAPPLSQIMNNFFCIFFTFEVVVHFMAFKSRALAFRSGKFLFDLILVVFMVWETWIEVILYLFVDVKPTSTSAFTSQLFRFFRLFRLTRVPRIVRLCYAVPEFLIMMRGMAAAMRSVLVILVFLAFTIYVFGVLFTELLRGVEPFTKDFPNVKASMNTLLLQVICGIDPDFLNALSAASFVYYIAYLLFVFLAIFTLMNMLIGVLCDVVSDVREAEFSNINAVQLEHDINQISHELDKDEDGTISRTEFDFILKSKGILKSLDGMGVDVVALAGLAPMIFKDEDNLTLSEFCQMIAHFRGSRVATLKDLLDTHKFITMEFENVFNEIHQIASLSVQVLKSSQKNPSSRSASSYVPI